MVALTICLFSSVVLAPSIEELADKFSALTVKSKSASHVAADFASIRQGSFTSVSDFRKAFPLERLLIDKPELFVRADLSSQFDQETLRCRETRTHAARIFIAHNYHQLDEAFAKMLRSTNDGFIAAVLSDPYGVADEDFVLPITDLFFDYIRAKADLCMIDLLPDVFRDRQVYNQYFTPIEGIEVVPNEEYGYTVVTADPEMWHVVGCSTFGKNRVVSLRMIRHDFLTSRNTYNIIVDTRTGCAISMPRSFVYKSFLELPGWLVISNADSSEGLIWRKDSKVPLVVKSQHCWLHLGGNGSRLVGLGPGVVWFTISTDPSEPFEVRQSEFGIDIDLPNKEANSADLCSGGSILLVTPERMKKCTRFGEDLLDGLTRALGTPLADALAGLTGHQKSVHLVRVYLSYLDGKRFAQVWYLTMGLRSRFNLRTKEDFIFFLVAVLKGYCPPDTAIPVPQQQSWLRGRLNSLSLRVTVKIDTVIRAIQSKFAPRRLPALPYHQCHTASCSQRP